MAVVLPVTEELLFVVEQRLPHERFRGRATVAKIGGEYIDLRKKYGPASSLECCGGSVNVVDGVEEEVDLGLRREMIEVPAGRFKTGVVEPFLRQEGIFVQKGKRLQVWLTDDERHVPVFMRVEIIFGSISAYLLRVDNR